MVDDGCLLSSHIVVITKNHPSTHHWSRCSILNRFVPTNIRTLGEMGPQVAWSASRNWPTVKEQIKKSDCAGEPHHIKRYGEVKYEIWFLIIDIIAICSQWFLNIINISHIFPRCFFLALQPGWRVCCVSLVARHGPRGWTALGASPALLCLGMEFGAVSRYGNI